MSTRGAIGVYDEGRDLFITYNHFDSYPDGLGRNVLEFILDVNRRPDGWETFRANCRALTLVDDDTKPTKATIKKYKELGYFDGKVASQKDTDWYCLLRNVQGATTFQEILLGRLAHVIDSAEFIKDSLFCEYAYIINLDEGVLEFYQGFQKRPDLTSRFGAVAQGDYYPCKLFFKFPLSDFKDEEWVKGGVEMMGELVKDEEE